jgi:predicted RNA binding protein YcfA (HicA-like mRNA interferase family)
VSPHLPALKPTEVIRALEKAGWYVHRQKGSHVIMHKDRSSIILVIPVHNRDLPKGTLHGIIADTGLTIEEFLEYIKR